MIYFSLNETFESYVSTPLLAKTAQIVLEESSNPPEADVTIVIEADEQLRSLNQQYRGIDAPTDVLSFTSDEIDPDTGHRYIGDIIISYPTADRQAQIAGHPVQNELQLLVVHGMLHLLGFDHATQEMKTEMWTKQALFLDRLGVEINKLPED